jgi:hypothetical protein
LTVHPTGRFESDIIGKHIRETVDVVVIKSFRSSFKRFACGHSHLKILPDRSDAIGGERSMRRLRQ